MEAIHIKILSFLHDWRLKNVEADVELDHISMAYLYGMKEGEGKEEYDYDVELHVTLTLAKRLHEATLHGYDASEVLMGRHYGQIRRVGSNVYKAILFQEMGEELGGMMEVISKDYLLCKWVALAYMYKGKSAFEDTMGEIIDAYSLEKEQPREIGFFNNARYQALHRQALYAYRYYTDGIS